MRALIIPAPAIAANLQEIVDDLDAAGIKVTLGSTDDLAAGEMRDFHIIAGPGTMLIDEVVISRFPSLTGLVSVGVGCEGFDRQAAARHGIVIRNGATRENTAGMASAAILLMLALCHDLPAAQRAVAEGRRRDTSRTRTLDECVVGLIGYGAIGQEVSRRLRKWDMEVLVFSPSRPAGRLPCGAIATSFDEILEASDLVSLHAALTPQNHHMIDQTVLGRFKPGAALINTARGGLVDEAALIEALQSGHLGGAALDCFEHEPLAADSELRRLPNVILTPHQLGHTASGMLAAVRAFCDNIIAVARSADRDRNPAASH